jgi:hypothetical protein
VSAPAWELATAAAWGVARVPESALTMALASARAWVVVRALPWVLELTWLLGCPSRLAASVWGFVSAHQLVQGLDQMLDRTKVPMLALPLVLETVAPRDKELESK